MAQLFPQLGFFAQFVPYASLRVTDQTLYDQIRSDYGISAPVDTIYGVSPVSLGAQYGIPVFNNPTSLDYNTLPNIFTTDSNLWPDSLLHGSVVLGTPISTSDDGINTLGGQDYTDINGEHFTTVTWGWQIQISMMGTSSQSTFNQQIVTWTGDAVAARLIPTTFALNVGKTAVLIWGDGGDPVWCTSDMITQGVHATYSVAPASATLGVMTMGATGFTVTDGAGVSVNDAGKHYQAVVWNDTTGKKLNCGHYHGGNATGSGTATINNAGSSITGTGAASVSNGSFTLLIANGTVTGANAGPGNGSITGTGTASGSGGGTVTLAGSGTATINGPSAGTTSAGNGTMTGFGSVPTTATNMLGAKLIMLVSGGTELGNSSGMFLETDHGSIVRNIQSNEVVESANQIVAMSGQGITIDAHASRLTTLGLTYYWVALALDVSDPVRTSSINTFTAVGTGAALTVSGLVFTPAFALAITTDEATSYIAGVFRGPTDAGTASHATHLGAGLASGGIESFGVGTLSVGTSLSKAAIPMYGIAMSGGSTSETSTVTPTWTETVAVPMADGHTALIEHGVTQDNSPGPGFTLNTSDPQWWCYTSLGYSIFQINSPGAGWVACSGPVSINGWYLSDAGFAGADTIVSAGRPADPRPWEKLDTWCAVGQMNVYGGSPAAACNRENMFVYPASNYVRSTDDPPIRGFNGRTDRELCRVPRSTTDVTSKAAMSFLAANDTVYFTTWDAGTTSADWVGRVFSLDVISGVTTVLGTKFAAGELPYALTWHMGRLWCGTNNGIGTIGKIYFFRPGLDTTWTLDHSTSTNTAGGVTSMASYKGKLYVGTDNAAASPGKVLVRDSLGVWSVSLTSAGIAINNGFPTMSVLGSNLYASYWDSSVPTSLVKKFNGTSWSDAYTGTGTTAIPFIQLPVQLTEMYVLGGAKPYDACLLVTSDGTTFTDLTSELPSETATLLPMFGAVGIP